MDRGVYVLRGWFASLAGIPGALQAGGEGMASDPAVVRLLRERRDALNQLSENVIEVKSDLSAVIELRAKGLRATQEQNNSERTPVPNQAVQRM